MRALRRAVKIDTLSASISPSCHPKSFNKRAGRRVLNLLEASYLRLREVVVKRITIIKFGVNVGGGDITSCCGIELRADTSKLMNVIALAGFGERERGGI